MRCDPAMAGRALAQLAGLCVLPALSGCVAMSSRAEFAARAEINRYAPERILEVYGRRMRYSLSAGSGPYVPLDEVLPLLGEPDLRAKPREDHFRYHSFEYWLPKAGVDMKDLEVLMWHPALRARMIGWAQLFVICRRDPPFLGWLAGWPVPTGYPQSLAVLTDGRQVYEAHGNSSLGLLCRLFAVPFSVAADAILSAAAAEGRVDRSAAVPRCRLSRIVYDPYPGLVGLGPIYGDHRLVLRHLTEARPVKFDVVEVSRKGERVGFAVVFKVGRRSSWAYMLEDTGSARLGDTVRILRTGPPDESRRLRPPETTRSGGSTP